MKNLKSVTILITAGLSLTLFGCSNTAVSGKDETTATLRIAVDSKYEPFIAEIAPEFEATHNVKVEFTGQDSFAAMDSLALDGPAGLAADVLMVPHDRIGSLAKMGMIQPIDITDVSSDFDQVAIDAVTFENQSYGLPAAIEVLMLMYNKDLLPEAPQTFAELEALTTQEEYKFANEPGRSTAFLAKFVDFYLAYSVLGGYGAEVFAEKNTDTKTVQLNNQGGIDGLDYIKSWLETFPIGLQDEQSASDFITQYFQEGKTASIIDGPWNVSNYLDAGVNLGLAPLPTLPNGSKPTPFAGIKTWAVTAFASDKEILALESSIRLGNRFSDRLSDDVLVEVAVSAVEVSVAGIDGCLDRCAEHLGIFLLESSQADHWDFHSIGELLVWYTHLVNTIFRTISATEKC